MAETGIPYAKRERLCRREIARITPECRERYISLANPLLRPLGEAGIRFAGFGTEGHGYSVKRFKPIWHTLIYTTSGGGDLSSRALTDRLVPGSLFIAPADQPHEYTARETPWRLTWFCFSTDNSFGFAPDSPQVIASAHNRLIRSVLEELVHPDAATGEWNAALVESYLQLLLRFLRNDTETLHQVGSECQRRSLDASFLAVHRNPSANWNVESLLEENPLTIGADRFRQLCNEYYGLSPMKKVRQIRMQVARELLLATDYPLRTIAPMAGYSNEFSFSNAFHASEGLSPDAFRRL